ncbi:helix-turn-helix domain-containing protein [Rhodococcus sp. NPDC003322]
MALRLTTQFDGNGDLAGFVRAAAPLPHIEAVLSGLTQRGLIADDRLTDDGRTLVTRIGTRTTELTRPIWTGLDAADTAAAERVLNEVLHRSRALLSKATA